MIDIPSNARVDTMLEASLVSTVGAPTVSCRIKDISDTGAKIEVDGSLTLPPEFDLKIFKTGETLRAEIRWRYGNKVGVRFVRPETGTPGEPTRDALIAENRKLREALETMAKRLTQLGELVVLPVSLLTPVHPV